MKCKTLQKYMTTNPHSVGSDQALKIAAEMMDKYRIRHLPVMDAGKVVGILTDRDIKLALSFQDINPKETKVSDIAKEEVYVASPSSKLEEVVGYMADRKLGSAVVMDNGKLVGIFTAVDALTTLSDVLHERTHGQGHSHGGGCCGH